MPIPSRPHLPGLRRSSLLWALLPLVGCGEPLGLDRGPMCAAVSSTLQTSGSVLQLSLTPGEICTLASDDAASVEIASSDRTAQYLVVVQSGSRVAGAISNLSLVVDATGGLASSVSRATGSESRGAASAAGGLSDASRSPSAGPGEGDASRAELRFRAAARRALAGKRPLRGSPTGSRRALRASVSSAVASGRPAVGDTIVFRNSVDTNLDVDCDGIHDVTAVIRGLGPSFGIAEDIEAAGPVSDADYAALLETLDGSVFPVDTTYFGSPADLDGNGIVWMLFSPLVNRVTPRGSPTRVSGFFNPSDLSDAASCAASNQGEILYVLAADPTGRFSDAVPAGFATTRAIGVAAHELEHLISAQRRVTLANGDFSDLEDSWLGEGLAHTAETAVGFRMGGLSPGGNAGFAELTADRASFDAFQFPNLRRAGFYLADSNGTLALGDGSGLDPGGVSSLEMRGFAWLFLRWFADQYAPGGASAGEAGVFRQLAAGGSSRARGVANIEGVAASLGAPPAWEDLLERYALAPLADDVTVPTERTTQVSSYALRDAFAGLHAERGDQKPFTTAYPLRRSTVGLSASSNARFDFDLRAATGRYFVLESVAGHPSVRIRLTTPTGAPAVSSSAVRLVLLRSR